MRYAKESIPYGMFRYVGETERLYGILNTQLADRDFIVGPGRGKFSIADIALLGWVNGARNSSVSLDEQFPHVKAWFERCAARPAVQRGLAIPSTGMGGLLQEPDAKQAAANAEANKKVADAKEKYGYKYASP